MASCRFCSHAASSSLTVRVCLSIFQHQRVALRSHGRARIDVDGAQPPVLQPRFQTRGGFARSHRLHTTGQGTFIDLRRDGAQLARRRCRRRRQTGKELHRPRRVPAEQLLATSR